MNIIKRFDERIRFYVKWHRVVRKTRKMKFGRREYENQDIEILEILMNKAKERGLGVNSIIYYYALKHALEEMKAAGKEKQIVHCIDCNWRGTKACFCKAPNDVQDDWFCSEGENGNEQSGNGKHPDEHGRAGSAPGGGAGVLPADPHGSGADGKGIQRSQGKYTGHTVYGTAGRNKSCKKLLPWLRKKLIEKEDEVCTYHPLR